MNCIYFFDKLFLNISSFLLIEEEPHVSMPFSPVFHINYFLAMFVCIIIADIKAETIFAL
jgi:Ni,Fe-hydrogenase I cytochrome b subunit